MSNTVIQFNEQDIALLPCSPRVLARLLESCLEGGGPQQLADIILCDAAFAVRLVHAAVKVDGRPLDAAAPVTCAVERLGLPVIKSIALQAASQQVGQTLPDRELLFLEKLRFSSQVAAQAAYCLAPSVNYLQVEEARFCGLLLNLGLYLMYAKYGARYVELAGEPYSRAELRRREDDAFQRDHLQLAEALLEEWTLDSFLLDAVRFLHLDIRQIEHSSQLIKIGRLAYQFSRQPDELTDNLRDLGEQLFNFSRSEMEHLFHWAHDLYASEAPPLTDGEALRQGQLQSVQQLNRLLFMLADREGIRARLGAKPGSEAMVSAARNLYLEACPATEAIFFLLDSHTKQLYGIPATGQPELIRELCRPLDAGSSLVARALLQDEPLDSFGAENALSVADQLLLRLCRSQGIYCQPLRQGRQLLGTVVLGIAARDDLERLDGLRLTMFAQLISETLAESFASRPLTDNHALMRRVSHEVSTPLTVIGNYAGVLTHLLEGTEESHLPAAIKKEIRRIDNILGYYLNQQELPSLSYHGVCLNRLLRETVETLTPGSLEPRHIKVRLKLQENLPELPTNALLVQQILDNLIKNAAEAINGNEDGVITLTTRDSFCSNGRHYAEILVEDNGPGIDAQVLGKLFQPVRSTKGPGYSGVGLSVVKDMVADLDGRISFYSSAKSGTSFCLQLPYEDLARATEEN